ncbi:MAG: hypothetical protein QGM50_11125 [Anaerolineae bacterium]|nr:hypothetical protein [Anaerolineae bacterium]MDK1119322.1 hypothetical protein [Anaerolineae bacterium]
MHYRRLVILAVSSMGYLVLLAIDFQTGTLRAGSTIPTLTAYFILFGAYLAAIIHSESNHWPWHWIWLPAVFFRLILIFTTPTLSDDVYRYIWDGHVANQGYSPYEYRIDAPELDSISIPARDLANHTWMASPYMPAAQWLFARLNAIFPPTPKAYQTGMVFFDLGVGLLIMGLLKLGKLGPQRVLIYLWSPLVILEIAHGAHLDAFMLFLTGAAIYFAYKQMEINSLRIFASPILLALATLTKIIPILILPILFWRWTWTQRIIYAGLTVGVLAGASIEVGSGLVGPQTGTGLFGALRIYADVWSFNAGPYEWFKQLAEYFNALQPDRVAKLVSLILVILAMSWAAWQARISSSIRKDLRLMALPLGTYIILTPTVHPWYLLILVLFFPFLTPGPDEPTHVWHMLIPWIYLSAALPLSYLTYLDPADYRELDWVRLVEWLPVVAGLLTVAFLNVRQRRAGVAFLI